MSTAATATGANFDAHLNRLISEASVRVIEEFHGQPRLKKNIEISQVRGPKLGSLSFLKPMIEENGSRGHSGLPSVIGAPPSASEAAAPGACKLNDSQLELYSLLTSYRDLLYTNETLENADDIQTVYLRHVLEHLHNSRARIISNNNRAASASFKAAAGDENCLMRDQGFTRPKILFLLPFRHSALRLGKTLLKLLGPNYSGFNLERFVEEFGDEDGSDSTLRPVATDCNKPADYHHTFHGNTDDAFRVGLKLTKKSLKFFADFYDSDIIIASPLGLKTIISPDERQALESASRAAAATATKAAAKTAPRKRNQDDDDDDDDGADQDDAEQVPANGDKDFLSSLEIVVLDQTDVFLMQNWEHLLDIMQLINQMPSKPRNCDIARVRPWHLENWSKYYRQLICFASVSVPLIHSFFQSNSYNYEGYLTLKHRIDDPQARMVNSQCKQHFLYFDSLNAKDACNDRYTFFTKQVLPRYTGLLNNKDDPASPGEPLDHTLIMVSSYFDYVRLRNYLRREKLSFTQICEYTEENKVAKARQLFYFGARQILLYTERCHFYHRYKIKGIRRIIFYEPPIYAKFYTELVNMLTPELQGKKFSETNGSGQSANQFVATTLFSNHDTLQMGAIVGYGNAVKLMQNKKSIT